MRMWSRSTSSAPIICVVGARPNYMKMAPIIRAFAEARIPTRLVHTGQHYDPDMNDRLFNDLGLPRPDVSLDVGSGSHAIQTAEIMRRFDQVLDGGLPAAVLVVGDVNSTIACALVAAKRQVPVIHVEAGLRSYDRRMPEEINRVLTDQIASLMFTTERSALQNLLREGIDEKTVHFVGHVMIDSLLAAKPRAVDPAETLRRAGRSPGLVMSGEGYGVVTLHRPSNVDQPETLGPLLDILNEVSERLPLVFAAHPRTRNNMERFGLLPRVSERLVILPPQGYLEMLGLLRQAKLVLTDSGGIQEETTALMVPCLTLRENTERPITVEQGTNSVVGQTKAAIHSGVDEILTTGGKRGRVPELWDGLAARRIAEKVNEWLRQ
jgi:UDP-N-acetylglucosamine 2-epimerase (non-hydrolysing)